MTDTQQRSAPDYRVETPVVLLVFNRPELTRRMVDAVAEVEPRDLFVVAGGPRADHPRDEERCARTREVIDGIDWDCTVTKRYYETNRGRADGVIDGLNWAFEQVPEAIVLEDDCIPTPDFFRFCERMLEEYRDDERVMAVNGTNRLETWRPDRQDYHFVTYQGVWGWATWRRAWQEYDREMRLWTDPEARERLRDVMCDEEAYQRQVEAFQKFYDGRSRMWTKPWRFAMAMNNALAVVPSKNLVANVGFDERARYTTDPDDPLADLPTYELDFPLEIREIVAPDREYRRECFERFRRPDLRYRLLARVPDPVADAVPSPVRRAVLRRL